MTAWPRDLLVFSLDGAVYALDAARVRTILWLPELSPAPEAPPGIAGRFNLRGEIVPVADLALCLGLGVHRRRAGDQVVVVDVDGATLGILVGTVQDLVHPLPEQILPLHPYGEVSADGLAAATLQLDEGLATLLDIRQLARTASLPRPAAAPSQEATPEKKALLQARAETLRHVAAGEEHGGRPLALVALGGQHFGIDLAEVREFCQVPRLCPLPCCPPHVAGAFNLRGQFANLLEVSSAFDLPAPAAPRTQAVIGQLEGKAVAIAVDEVIDIFTPRPEDLRPLPMATAPMPGGVIRAVTSLNGRRVFVLDLAALLQLERWVVDEGALPCSES